MTRECVCGSGLESWVLSDARGIYCARVCSQCEADKRGEFRPEIFSDPDYETDEAIDEGVGEWGDW